MRGLSRFLLCLTFAVLLSGYVSPAQARQPFKRGTAIVVSPSAEVFRKSSERSEHVTEVLMGDEFRVIRARGAWAFGSIPSQDGYRGWIRMKDISFLLSASPFKGMSFVLVRSTVARITLRDGSSTEVFAGTSLPLLKAGSGRYEVIMPDGSTGFLSADSGTIEDDSFGKYVTPADILRASRFFNSHYKWGGITAGGMDCSGFVYTVFRINGIYLRRDSYMQAEEGTPVSFSELKAGDLVFFTSGKGGRITHVGIYIGQGNFIHSSRGKRGVGVSNLTEGYFRKRFATARRILSDVNPTAGSKRTPDESAANSGIPDQRLAAFLSMS